MFKLLLPLLVSAAQYDVNIVDISKTPHCKILVFIDGQMNQKFIENCELEKQDKEIAAWIKSLVKK